MKNKSVYKIISVILIILILCSVFFTVSCSQNSNANNINNANNDDGKETGKENADNAGDNAQDAPESEPEAVQILSEAPVKDYDGYDFRILSREAQTADHHWEANDIVAEEENADLVNDAVYKRNTVISEKYNISISRTDNVDPAALARKAVQSGSDEYDLMFASINATVTAAQNGVLINLKNVQYLDLAKPWYDQNANAQLSIGGKLYATFCDFTIMDKNATWVYLFNKQLIQDLDLENPYKLVNEGKWTIDKMAEMAKAAAKDLDGDGVMTWHDQFGWEGECWNMYAGIIAAGIQTVTKNKEDLPEYAGLGDRGMLAFTKLLSVVGDKNVCLRSDDITNYSGNLWNDVMDASFMEGRILFTNAGMNRVTLFRSMDTDFGIIPSPKLDENQPEYCDTISPAQATALSVPASVSDIERTGIITDALCAESKYTLIPAYYDIQLKTKFARDDESAEMLDIIFRTRSFDLCLIYGWGDLTGLFSNAMKSNNENITSSIEKVEPKIITAIGKTVEAYDKNEN